MQTATTKIDTAVAPLRAAAMDMAEARARRIVQHVRKTIEATPGHDLQICAPFPRSTLGRHEYHEAKRKYQLYRAVTKSTAGGSRSMRSPEPVEMCAERVERFVKEARAAAEQQFVLYAKKLNHKIGQVVSAELVSDNEQTGENIWHYSQLRVVVAATGEQQVWRTRLVHNQSKLGTPYVQFPTRQVKMGGR